MASLDSKKTQKSLLKKGFRLAGDNKSNDHKRYEFFYKNKLTRFRTKISHNNQDLNDFLCSQMGKQIGLNKTDFISFANCTMSEISYIEKVKEYLD
jgi:hypothetical protein